jgi:glucokinase
MGKFCIGIDLGGTYIKLALLAVGNGAPRAAGDSRISTPDGGADQIVAAMAGAAKDLMARHQVSPSDALGVGIGAPGPLNCAKGIVVNAPNLPSLSNFHLRDRVSAALNMPAVLENDANAAALGEYLLGAGRSARCLVMLTLGTGVGGGIVAEGKILHGSHDFAGEVGHMIVEPNGFPCNCGQRGCLEQYSSATFLARRAAEAVMAGRHSSLSAVLKERGAVNAEDVNAARLAGDEVAKEAWDSAARHLAIACVNLHRLLDLDRIVLGGGLSRAGDDLLTPISKHYAALDWRMTDQRPELAIAELGKDAGVIGAACVAWQAFAP